MKERHEALGPMTFHEISVFVCFVTVIVLWFFRRPLFMPGTQFLNEYMPLKRDFRETFILDKDKKYCQYMVSVA